MGACWSGFLVELQKIRRPIDYIGRSHEARAARYNVRDRGDGIEFDNLLSEDDFEIETRPRQKVLTDEECTFINQKRYGDLVEKQKKINVQIDEKLKMHEDNLQLEEEEFYAAKREAARVAKQEKAKKQKTDKDKTNEKLNNVMLDDSAFASWLSDEEDGQEDDHDIDTQEFEEFLEKVRQTSFNSPMLHDVGKAEKEDLANNEFENSLNNGVEATKLAEQSLDALETWSPTFDDDDDD